MSPSERIQNQRSTTTATATTHRKHEDDSMSIDWTLNIRRKCCRFFGQQQQQQQPKIVLGQQETRSQSDMIKTRTRQQNHQDLGVFKKEINNIEDDNYDQDPFINSFQQIDCCKRGAAASAAAAAAAAAGDNLSALSASSSLLSQLLNSSLNQLIEIDNGSDSEHQQDQHQQQRQQSQDLGKRLNQVDERDLRLVSVATSSARSSTSATLTNGSNSTSSINSISISISSSSGRIRPPSSSSSSSSMEQKLHQQTFVTFLDEKKAKRRKKQLKWKRLCDFEIEKSAPSSSTFLSQKNNQETTTTTTNMSFTSDDLNERFKNLRLDSESPPDVKRQQQQQTSKTTPSNRRCSNKIRAGDQQLQQQVFAMPPSSEVNGLCDTQNDSLFGSKTSRLEMECGYCGDGDITTTTTLPAAVAAAAVTSIKPQTTLINANSGQTQQQQQHHLRQQHQIDQLQQQQQQQQQHDSLLETSLMGEEAPEGTDTISGEERDHLDQLKQQQLLQQRQEVNSSCDFECCPVCEFQFDQLIRSAQTAATETTANNSRDQTTNPLELVHRQIIREEEEGEGEALQNLHQQLPSQILSGCSAAAAVAASRSSSKVSINSSKSNSSTNSSSSAASSSDSSSSNSGGSCRGSAASSCAIRVTTSSDSSEDSSDRLLKLKQHLRQFTSATSAIADPVLSAALLQLQSTKDSDSEMGLASSNHNKQQIEDDQNSENKLEEEEETETDQQERNSLPLHRTHSDRSQLYHHHHHNHSQLHHQRNCCFTDCGTLTAETKTTNQSVGVGSKTFTDNLTDWILDESPFIIKGPATNSATTQLLSVTTKVSPNKNHQTNINSPAAAAAANDDDDDEDDNENEDDDDDDDDDDDEDDNDDDGQNNQQRMRRRRRRNSIQFSLDPRDLSVKKETFLQKNRDEEDKSSMVEAKAKLARVVDIDDSSCFSSSIRSYRHYQQKQQRNSTIMMRDLRGSERMLMQPAPPLMDNQEPIYDIPSASPNIMINRQATTTTTRCLSPDEKYPTQQNNATNKRRPLSQAKVELSNDLVMIEKDPNMKHYSSKAAFASMKKGGPPLRPECTCDKCRRSQFRALNLYLSTKGNHQQQYQQQPPKQEATNDSSFSLFSRLAEYGSGASRVRNDCLSSNCSCSTCSSSSTLIYLAERKRRLRQRKKRSEHSCSCCCSCSSSAATTTTTTDCSCCSSSSSSITSTTECSNSNETHTTGSLTQEYLRRHRRSYGRIKRHRTGATRRSKSTKQIKKGQQKEGSRSHVEPDNVNDDDCIRLLHHHRHARATEGAQLLLAGNGLSSLDENGDGQDSLLMEEEHAMQLNANGNQQQQQQQQQQQHKQKSKLSGQRVGGRDEEEDNFNGQQINDLRLSRPLAGSTIAATASMASEPSKRRSRLLLMQKYERLSEERSAELNDDDDDDDGDDLDGRQEMKGSSAKVEMEDSTPTIGKNKQIVKDSMNHQKVEGNYDCREQSYLRQRRRQQQLLLKEKLTPESSCSCHASNHHRRRKQYRNSFLPAVRLVRNRRTSSAAVTLAINNNSRGRKTRISHSHHHHHHHRHQHLRQRHHHHHHHNRSSQSRHHHHHHHIRQHKKHQNRHAAAAAEQLRLHLSSLNKSGNTFRNAEGGSDGNFNNVDLQKSQHLCHLLPDLCRRTLRTKRSNNNDNYNFDQGATNSHGRNPKVKDTSSAAAAVGTSTARGRFLLFESAAEEQRQKAKLIRRLLRRQQELDALETEFKQLELTSSSAALKKTAAAAAAVDTTRSNSKRRKPLAMSAQSDRIRVSLLKGAGRGRSRNGRLKLGTGSQSSLSVTATNSHLGRRHRHLGRRRHFLHSSNYFNRGSFRRLSRRRQAKTERQQQQQQFGENGSLFMNKFLVKKIQIPTGKGKGKGKDSKRETNNRTNEKDGDLFSGWQLTKRCQCSHCCLVEKFILIDAQRKRQRKLARKLFWRQQCDAAINLQPTNSQPTSPEIQQIQPNQQQQQ